MILLPQQIQAIIFHLLSGWLFGLTYSFYNRLAFRFKHTWYRNLSGIIYFLFFVTGMFYGLYKLNGGQTQIFLIVFFLLGIWIYLQFYAMTFSPLFSFIAHCVKKCFIFGRVAISRFLAIIDIRTKLKVWRQKHHVKRIGKTRKKGKTETK